MDIVEDQSFVVALVWITRQSTPRAPGPPGPRGQRRQGHQGHQGRQKLFANSSLARHPKSFGALVRIAPTLFAYSVSVNGWGNLAAF